MSSLDAVDTALEADAVDAAGVDDAVDAVLLMPLTSADAADADAVTPPTSSIAIFARKFPLHVFKSSRLHAGYHFSVSSRSRSSLRVIVVSDTHSATRGFVLSQDFDGSSTQTRRAALTWLRAQKN